MKAKIFISLISLITLISPTPVLAKKKLFSGTSSRGVSLPTAGVVVRPRLRVDRRALVVNFSGLTRTTSVVYTLSYTAAGVGQGVSGTIKPIEDLTSRELLFGTCSKNVCTYNRNITGMKFIVTSYLKSGKKVVKSFRVKP